MHFITKTISLQFHASHPCFNLWDYCTEFQQLDPITSLICWKNIHPDDCSVIMSQDIHLGLILNLEAFNRKGCTFLKNSRKTILQASGKWGTAFPGDAKLESKVEASYMKYLKTCELDEVTHLEGGGRVTWENLPGLLQCQINCW
jgi:hypothetical protein